MISTAVFPGGCSSERSTLTPIPKHTIFAEGIDDLYEVSCGESRADVGQYILSRLMAAYCSGSADGPDYSQSRT